MKEHQEIFCAAKDWLLGTGRAPLAEQVLLLPAKCPKETLARQEKEAVEALTLDQYPSLIRSLQRAQEHSAKVIPTQFSQSQLYHYATFHFPSQETTEKDSWNLRNKSIKKHKSEKRHGKLVSGSRALEGTTTIGFTVNTSLVLS